MEKKKTDKQLYLLAELDDDSQAQLREFDKVISENGIIGKQTKDIPYHITLCPFSVEMEDYLKSLLDELSHKYKKIDVKCGSLGLFGLNVLFMNPDMNSDLIELYNYVKEKSFDKDNDLSAHITILMDEPENIMKILPKIAERYKGITGKISHISLYEFFPKRFIKRIKLQRDNDI
jgi:2'-5' RNA ligase